MVWTGDCTGSDLVRVVMFIKGVSFSEQMFYKVIYNAS